MTAPASPLHCAGGGGGVQASPPAPDQVAGNGIPLRRISCPRRSVVRRCLTLSLPCARPRGPLLTVTVFRLCSRPQLCLMRGPVMRCGTPLYRFDCTSRSTWPQGTGHAFLQMGTGKSWRGRSGQGDSSIVMREGNSLFSVASLSNKVSLKKTMKLVFHCLRWFMAMRERKREGKLVLKCLWSALAPKQFLHPLW